MAQSTLPKVRRDGSIVVADSAAHTYTIGYEDGDVSFKKDKAARIVVRNRGVITTVRKGDDPVIQLSFSVHMRQFTGGTDVNLCDVLEGTGKVATIPWVNSTAIYAAEFASFDWTFQVEGTTPDGADHTAVFRACVGTWDFAEGDPNKISVTLECHGGVTFTGPA